MRIVLLKTIKDMKKLLLSVGLLGLSMTVKAQLSSNPDKFLGNITTRYQVEAGGGVPQYYKLWNQITCENESKWSSVEGIRNQYNWGCDNAFNYAKQHKFTYKFHALVWGAQYPGWLPNLTPKDRYAAIVKWFDAVKKKYNTLPMIDVVNEAIGMHQQGNPMMKETLGGGGKTGYDWLIKAFEMAYERFPNSILIYNDYNSIRWDIDNYITLVRTLRDAGAPIDAYGNQSHDVNDISASELKSALKKQQDALKMPMFITELDIDVADDNKQKAQYESILPLMWEADYCAGVTLWGYIHGATWVDNSGLYKNGKERPAMTWLKQYMTTDKAKNAKSPYPGMKKRVGVYVRPKDFKVAKGDVLPIKVRTHITDDAKKENPDIAIEKVELYDGTSLIAEMTQEPYVTEYQLPSTATGTRTLKAIVYTNDGNKYERLSRVSVLTSTVKRAPYNETVPELPCTINAAEFDKGAASVTYNNAPFNYNTRASSSATKDASWMEYTVDVKEDGLYSYDIDVASAKTGGSFYIAEYGLDNLDFLTEYVDVPKTGSNTEFKTLHGRMQIPLTAGRHVFCLNITKGGFYIDKMTFTRCDEDSKMTVNVSSVKPTSVPVGDKATINVTAKSTTSTIANVKFYANNLLIGTVDEAPYEFEFEPTEKGTYSITAIATDAEGKEKMSAAKTLKVTGKRVPYKNVIDIPGVIQAENFDKGGEGLTFHDSDDNDEGDAKYRTDNEGLDLVKGNGSSAIGYTAKGEWTEYSVNVTEAGDYACEATVSSGTTGSGFTVGLVKNGKVTDLFKINVPQTGNNNWDTYKVVKVDKVTLNAGEQILRITIDGINCNIDKLEFKSLNPSGIMAVEAKEQNAAVYTLQGVMVGTTEQWNTLPSGVYVVDGNKRIKR